MDFNKAGINVGATSLSDEELLKRKVIFVINHVDAVNKDDYKKVIRSIYEGSMRLNIRWTLEKKECSDGEIFIFHKKEN